MKRRCIAASVLAVAACASDTYDPPSKVDTLRVLAVRADKPFAQPGERVHLDTLVADPKGNGRVVRFAWATCVNPGSGEVTDCAAVASPFAPGAASWDVTVPANVLDGQPANAPIGTVGVLFAACAGAIVDERTPSAPVRCVDAQGASVGRDGFMWGEKRVIAVNGVRNQNPGIAAVRLDGAPWDASTQPVLSACGASGVGDCPGDQQHTLEIVPAPGSAEMYDGLTEDLVGFFFVSGGGVADDFVRQTGDSFSTVLAPTGVAAGTVVTVWLVLRDDRGGVDWQVRSYVVR